MKAAIYTRVSGKSNRQETENQAIQLREFVSRQGWELTMEYSDRKTGTTADRDAFQQMMRDASQRRFDVLVFWDLSRLSREGVLATLQHLALLDTYQVRWKSFTQQYLDSSIPLVKDIAVSIHAAIAKDEHERISNRVRAGLERAKRAGVRLGRPEVIVDKHKVASMHAQGCSMRTIAAKVGVSVFKVHSILHS